MLIACLGHGRLACSSACSFQSRGSQGPEKRCPLDSPVSLAEKELGEPWAQGTLPSPGPHPCLAHPPLPGGSEPLLFAKRAWPVISSAGDAPSEVVQEGEALGTPRGLRGKPSWGWRANSCLFPRNGCCRGIKLGHCLLLSLVASEFWNTQLAP